MVYDFIQRLKFSKSNFQRLTEVRNTGHIEVIQNYNRAELKICLE